VVAHLLFDGLVGLQAWPGLVVVVGLAFIAMGADLARHERNNFSERGRPLL
jgi:hypothetical protein